MKEEIKKKVMDCLENGDNVRVHVSKIDTTEKYTAVIGVYVNGELDEVFDMENITNTEIDSFTNELEDHIRSKTLFLI